MSYGLAKASIFGLHLSNLILSSYNRQIRREKMSFYCFVNGMVINTAPTFQYYLLQSFLQNDCRQNPPPMLNISPPSIEPVINCTSTSSPKACSEQAMADVQAAQRRRETPKRERRRKNLEKEIQSARKNSESNIVHQLFAYLSQMQRSQNLVEKAVCLLDRPSTQNQRITKLFYNIVKLINFKRGRKYSNRNTIRNYYTPSKVLENLPDIEDQLAEVGLISLQEFCRLFRICSSAFLRVHSIPAILTSKRISQVAKRDHLRRRNQVVDSLRNAYF